MESGYVTGMHHAGITVNNLEESVDFYRKMFNFEQLAFQESDQDYILELLNVPGLQKVRIALMKIPGSETVLELLEYVGVERHSASARPCDYGSGHLCFQVSDLSEMHRQLLQKGARFRSPAPVEITAGRNKGAKVIYMADPDGYLIELWEEPK